MRSHATPDVNPLFLITAATCAFVVLRTAGSLVWGDLLLPQISAAAVVPSVLITLLACKQSLKGVATWLLALLCIPVVIRMTLVAQSWQLLHAGTLAAGALVGFYVLAGVRLRSVVTAEEPLAVAGAWHPLVMQARTAQKNLVEELKLHVLAPQMKQELTAQSQRLLQSVEKSAQMWSRLERSGSSVLEDAVKAQLENIQKTAAAASDDVAAREYGRTAEALTSQLDAIRRIRINSERALARVRTQVTTMETARLSVMAYAAQDDASRSDDAQRLSQVLAHASEELDITAGALEEAHGTSVPRISSGS